MVLVDTSIWIEFLKGKRPFFDDLSVMLADRQVLAASCVFGELLQGVRSDKESKVIIGFWHDLPKVPPELYVDAWIEAGRVSYSDRWYSKGIGLIDATVLCLARKSAAKLWSLDKQVNSVAAKWSIRF